MPSKFPRAHRVEVELAAASDADDAASQHAVWAQRDEVPTTLAQGTNPPRAPAETTPHAPTSPGD